MNAMIETYRGAVYPWDAFDAFARETRARLADQSDSSRLNGR